MIRKFGYSRDQVHHVENASQTLANVFGQQNHRSKHKSLDRIGLSLKRDFKLIL